MKGTGTASPRVLVLLVKRGALPALLAHSLTCEILAADGNTLDVMNFPMQLSVALTRYTRTSTTNIRIVVFFNLVIIQPGFAFSSSEAP